MVMLFFMCSLMWLTAQIYACADRASTPQSAACEWAVEKGP